MVATTSGTVNATVIDVTTLIEHAVRRCGVLPSMLSSELQLSAKESLFFLLADLSNDGISLWCINKYAMPLEQGKSVYGLPPGATDILNMVYRTAVVLTGTPITGAAYSGLQFATATSPGNVRVSFTVASTPALVVERSNDNVTWTQAAAFTFQQSEVPAGQGIAQDVDVSVPALYWRIRDTSGVLPPGASITWTNYFTEVPMIAFNRDDYFALPNKAVQGAKSLQYWFDKQINPQLWLWPVPSSATDQVVVQYHRLIQDVGALSGLLEVPSRWFEHIVFALACRVAIEVPPALLPEGRLVYLEEQRATSLERAADGESDGSPIRLQPNLRGYT